MNRKLATWTIYLTVVFSGVGVGLLYAWQREANALDLEVQIAALESRVPSNDAEAALFGLEYQLYGQLAQVMEMAGPCVHQVAVRPETMDDKGITYRYAKLSSENSKLPGQLLIVQVQSNPYGIYQRLLSATQCGRSDAQPLFDETADGISMPEYLVVNSITGKPLDVGEIGAIDLSGVIEGIEFTDSLYGKTIHATNPHYSAIDCCDKDQKSQIRFL
jgi:hypothetical protein